MPTSFRHADVPADENAPANPTAAANPHAARTSAPTVAPIKNALSTHNPSNTHKRALGDITNAAAPPHPQQRTAAAAAPLKHVSVTTAPTTAAPAPQMSNSAAHQPPKIRRTATTKMPSAARRAKAALAAAAARRATSPMPVASAALPAASGVAARASRIPDRIIAKRPPSATSAAAAAAAAAAVASSAAALAQPHATAISAAIPPPCSAGVFDAAPLAAAMGSPRAAFRFHSAVDAAEYADAQLPAGVIDIDDADVCSCLHVPQFAAAIHRNLLAVEQCCQAEPNYMQRQADITVKMRAILIDWLVDVHTKFRLRPETLFLTVNVIDRYLAKAAVVRRKLQLVGVAAMLIASKYEEIFSPEIADFVYISDHAYTKKEIIAMEAVMLNELGFEVTVPYSLKFLQRCLKAAHATGMAAMDVVQPDGTTVDGGDLDHLAHYLVELALPDSGMLCYRPSVIAAAACNLAGSLVSRAFCWDATMTHYCGGWSEDELASCEDDLRRLLMHEVDVNASNKLTAVKRKFASAKFNHISTGVAFLLGEDAVCAAPTGMDICTPKQ